MGQKYATVNGSTDEDNDYDRKRTQVPRGASILNLLKKADIEEYKFISNSLYSERQRRFEFFSSWDPDALGTRYSQRMVPIHDALEFADVKSNAVCFQMALKAGMKYFPERLGFLFREDDGIHHCMQKGIW